MKKTMITLMVLALALTACAGMRSTSSSTAAPTQVALPASMQVILGTFRLEGTAQAVSAGQAAELLPLWQVYQDLEGSGTAAQEEIDALVGQIQETMSQSQIQAIQAMGLTQADVMTVMAEQELVEAAPQMSSGSTVSAGGLDGGMPPADMGGEDPTMMGGAAPVSVSSSGSGSGVAQPGVPSALLEALIQLLQTRAA